MVSPHPNIDSRNRAAQTCRVSGLGPDGRHGKVHVMHTDGLPTCQLRSEAIHPDLLGWETLGEAEVTCGHCLNGSISCEVSGREPSGGWGAGTGGAAVALNPPKNFVRADDEERRRRMARRLPLDTPWKT